MNSRDEQNSVSKLAFWVTVGTFALLPFYTEASSLKIGRIVKCPHFPLRLKGGNRMLNGAQCCRLCAKAGHNARTCPSREVDFSINSNSRSDSSDSQSITQPITLTQALQGRKCKCGSDDVTHGIASRIDGN